MPVMTIRLSRRESARVATLAQQRRVTRSALVRQAIARLPRREVEILLLKYTENWSYEQLAQRLGTSESAIESRLHRARGRLRRELAAVEGARVES